MTIETKVLKHHRLIVNFVTGRIDDGVSRAAIDEVADTLDGAWNTDRITLIDEKSDLSRIDLGQMAAAKDYLIQRYFEGRVLDPSDLPAFRIAMVCPQSTNMGIANLFESVWEQDRTAYVAVKAFDTIADALAWLGRDDAIEAEIRQIVGIG
jgi:hypothetical protein